MRTIAVANAKGGSAKTTTTVNLAAAFAAAGQRVLVLDLDPQAAASAWLGTLDGGRGLADVFTEGRGLTGLARATAVPGLDLIAASAALGAVERAPAGEARLAATLRQEVERLPADRWQILLADCPPGPSRLAGAALAACHEVLVPVEAHALALAGLEMLLQTIERVRERLNPEILIAAILACRVTRTRHARAVMEGLRERFGDLVLEPVIRQSVRLAEAPSTQRPINVAAPRSSGAEDYRAVAAALLARVPGAPVPASGRAGG